MEKQASCGALQDGPQQYHANQEENPTTAVQMPKLRAVNAIAAALGFKVASTAVIL
jgi:hypothetical protein